MSSEQFIALANYVMTDEDAALLVHCNLNPTPVPETGSGFVDFWIEFERTMRLQLAKGRAQKLKRAGDSFGEIPEYPIDAAAAAKAALALDSPFEAEIMLDKARWDAIDSFVGLDLFSENAMYAYLLKILLLERRAAFETEKGFAEYKALYTAILGSENHGEAK
jgi:hypothetical protein